MCECIVKKLLKLLCNGYFIAGVICDRLQLLGIQEIDPVMVP